MTTRLISKTWSVDGVLTNVTTAKLSDPTGTYGIKRNDTDAVVVADGTSMTNSSTGVYDYSFTDTVDIAYTAYVEFVYAGSTYHFEVDIPARATTGVMVASYSSLLERVGNFAFGIRSSYSADQTTDIEEAIKDGLHDVYTAYAWSFFRPVKRITTTAPYATGTITIASGVVTLVTGTWPSWAAQGVLEYDDEYYEVNTRDSNSQITLEDTSVTEAVAHSYELSRMEYDLPTGFEAIVGDTLEYQPGQSDFYPAVQRKHDEELMRLQQDDPYTDRPIYFSVRTVEFDPTVGSRRVLALYPPADATYVLKVPMKLRPTMIDVTNQYPVGAESLSQVITEACLAAAERNFDDLGGVHTKRVHGDMEAPPGSAARLGLLQLAIRDDMETTAPRSLGSDAPQGEDSDWISRSVRMGDVSLNGTVL
mgnify:CR=1 FL=1